MILDDIAEYTKQRVQALKAKKSLYAVRDEAEGRSQGKDFGSACSPRPERYRRAEESLPLEGAYRS